MKRIGSALLCLLLVAAFGFFALASTSDSGTTDNQGQGNVEQNKNDNSNLGDYKVEILSCRLAKTFDDKSAVIVKYAFTNNSDKATNFSVAFEDKVYQDGIGLNHAYFLADDANYSADNQTKDIKPGARLEVEVAYELNDSTTDIEVEISEWISWNDSVVKKTFSIAS